MTHDGRKTHPQFEDAIEAVRGDEPSAQDIQSAGERVWARMTDHSQQPSSTVEQIHGCTDVRQLLPAFVAGTLPSARALLVQDHIRECVKCRASAQTGDERPFAWNAPSSPAAGRFVMRRYVFLAAAVVVIAVSAFVLNDWFFATPAGARATVQSVEGTLYRVSSGSEQLTKAGDQLAEGDVIRSGPGSHAFVRLRDGSVVEMSERAEFSVAARRNDTTVKLDRGRIIVEAAKRRTGHLYVVTPDCRVAVTGTVFAVNAGMKGSRVSVVEGEVHVSFAGVRDVLHSGGQVATSANISAVPVRDDIAWSRNLDKHLALLAEFAKLQNKIDQIPMPGLRYSSNILNRVPSDAIVYASVPNLGNALSDANRIFQDQLQQSPVLREWWARGHKGTDAADFERIIEKLHIMSQYLGDEVAFVGLPGHAGVDGGGVAIAEVRREGLADFLRSQFGAGITHDGKSSRIQVITPDQLNSLSSERKSDGILALVRPDFVLFSAELRALQQVNAVLQSGAGGFASTDFGRRISEAYARGAGFLLAFHAQQALAADRAKAHGPKGNEFQRTGFADARFIIAEHRELNGVPDNRAVIEFTGQRHGIASWLAAPAPIGSLDFVSANAGLAVAFVNKSPALMVDDILQIASGPDGKAQRDFRELETKLNVNVRDDLAASFGGDVAWALDGPVLPTPSWKVVAQVFDSVRLQNALENIVRAGNTEAQQHGQPGVTIQQERANDQTFYTVRTADPKSVAQLHYTFADGYMIAAPSRALVINALRTKANGNSLARSGEFRSLLPRDQFADFSGLFYQNLAPVIQPIASQLSAQQLRVLQQLAVDSKPTVVCAYGEQARIEVVSSSKLLPLNLNVMALSSLMGRDKVGTYHVRRP